MRLHRALLVCSLVLSASVALAKPATKKKATAANPKASSTAAEKPAEPQGLSADEVRRVVESRMGELKKCLAIDPPPTGKLVVHYVISAAGKVERPSAKSSSTGSAKLDGCIVDVFRRLEFPAPKNGIAMEQLYPFTFAAPKVAPPAHLDEKQVIDTVTAHSADIKGCMSEATKGKAGVLTVELDVDGSGTVLAARSQKSTTTVALFDSCVLAAARKWQFPKPEGTGILTLAFPIALNATAGAATPVP